MLLPLRGSQIQTLFEAHWVGVDRLKFGSPNYRAFTMDPYFFISELNETKMLHCEPIIRNVIRIIHFVCKSLQNQPNIINHAIIILGLIIFLNYDKRPIILNL